jgi:hypothetical protein
MVRIMRVQLHVFSSRTFMALAAHAWMALFCAIHIPSFAFAHDDAHRIRTLVGTTWDKPGSKVVTDPISISGQYAVASWTQGERGGRALLRRDEKGWSVVLCSGDALKSPSGLVEVGVPAPDAQEIARKIQTAEALLPHDRRAKFSLFEGAVSMEGDAQTSSSHHQHKH